MILGALRSTTAHGPGQFPLHRAEHPAADGKSQILAALPHFLVGNARIGLQERAAKVTRRLDDFRSLFSLLFWHGSPSAVEGD